MVNFLRSKEYSNSLVGAAVQRGVKKHEKHDLVCAAVFYLLLGAIARHLEKFDTRESNKNERASAWKASVARWAGNAVGSAFLFEEKSLTGVETASLASLQPLRSTQNNSNNMCCNSLECANCGFLGRRW